ncbi:MAG: PH domain-containing protein [Prolixibacteraceae bacterium]|jgi:hypothetical protein|nr:PH domain-containing protein [Prolixibacteraceae bacterium]
MGLFSTLLGTADEMDQDDLLEEYQELMAHQEELVSGYSFIRDTIIFTNKRLIIVDKQGLTGKKKVMISVAYKAISRFCIETSGHLDFDGELRLWIGSEKEPSIIEEFDSGVNLIDVQRILARYAL